MAVFETIRNFEHDEAKEKNQCSIFYSQQQQQQ